MPMWRAILRRSLIRVGSMWLDQEDRPIYRVRRTICREVRSIGFQIRRPFMILVLKMGAILDKGQALNRLKVVGEVAISQHHRRLLVENKRINSPGVSQCAEVSKTGGKSEKGL